MTSQRGKPQAGLRHRVQDGSSLSQNGHGAYLLLLYKRTYFYYTFFFQAHHLSCNVKFERAPWAATTDVAIFWRPIKLSLWLLDAMGVESVRGGHRLRGLRRPEDASGGGGNGGGDAAGVEGLRVYVPRPSLVF